MKISKILIIDDDSDFRKLLEVLLLKIVPAVSIDQFDPVARGRPGQDFDWTRYDLLLLDYDLGQGENGLDWLREYKNDPSFPATILLTAHGNEELVARSIRLGAQDYLSKQKISKQRLLEVIKNALKVHLEQSRLVTTQNLRTTIFNKVYFYKKLREIIKQNDPGKLSFILQVMIDDFQQLNKHIGILRTDHLVSEIAEEISKLLVSDKYQLNVTRIGDASIGCLVSGVFSKNDGAKFTDTLCKELGEKSFFHHDKKIPFSVSIGIAQIVNSDGNIDNLLQNVAQACESAQSEKGNSYSVYVIKSTSSSAVEAEDISAKPADSFFNLQEAIDNNRVQVYFQPMIAMSTSAAMSNAEYAQVQVRLLDSEGRAITPHDLKDTSLQDSDRGLLDRWLIRYGLGKLLSAIDSDSNQKYGLVLPLSGESLATTSFSGWMAKLILKSKISNIASTIVFEINPTDFLSSKANTLSIMSLMRDKWGVSFALTDVINVKVLDTCLHRGKFEFIKLGLDKDKINDMSTIVISCKKSGSSTILDNIQDGEGLAHAAQTDVDYVLGDFIQPPQDELVYIDDSIEQTTL